MPPHRKIRDIFCFTNVRLSVCPKLNLRGGLVERPPREREVVGSIPGRDGPKSLKLVVVAFSLGAQDYGNSASTSRPVLV